jgi:hypothetical protein
MFAGGYFGQTLSGPEFAGALNTKMKMTGEGTIFKETSGPPMAGFRRANFAERATLSSIAHFLL